MNDQVFGHMQHCYNCMHRSATMHIGDMQMFEIAAEPQVQVGHCKMLVVLYQLTNIVCIVSPISLQHTLVQVATVLEQELAPQVRLDAGPTMAQVPHQTPHLREASQ